MIDKRATALPAPWGEHEVPRGETLTVELGPLTLRARAPDDEIWLSHVPGTWNRPADPMRTTPASEEEWVRWPVADGTDRISVSPAFPSRPVVAEPELGFRLLPGAEARIFVRVPLWTEISALIRGTAERLVEFPTIVLSDTWWGGLADGELCYWLATTARRRVEPEVFAPHLAVCPLRLINESGEELQVEKLALRVEHLSVFSDEGRFWADETRIRYQGEDEGSDIEVAGRAPREATGAVRVASPRSPLPRGLRGRTFARLKAFSNLAGLQ